MTASEIRGFIKSNHLTIRWLADRIKFEKSESYLYAILAGYDSAYSDEVLRKCEKVINEYRRTV